jgi:hypothetical protein
MLIESRGDYTAHLDKLLEELRWLKDLIIFHSL